MQMQKLHAMSSSHALLRIGTVDVTNGMLCCPVDTEQCCSQESADNTKHLTSAICVVSAADASRADISVPSETVRLFDTSMRAEVWLPLLTCFALQHQAAWKSKEHHSRHHCVLLPALNHMMVMTSTNMVSMVTRGWFAWIT